MKIAFYLVALVAASAASASVIPPSALVVTRCGIPVAGYEMTKGKIIKHTADLQQFAARVPFSQRLEAGCNR